MRSYHIALISLAAVDLVRKIGMPTKEFLVDSLRAECQVSSADAIDGIVLAVSNRNLVERGDGLVALGPNAPHSLVGEKE